MEIQKQNFIVKALSHVSSFESPKKQTMDFKSSWHAANEPCKFQDN